MSETGPVDPSTLQPGMEFCTFDYQKWGDLHEVRASDGEAYLVGTVDATGASVYVPASAIVETHGQCIRLTHPMATINEAGWGQRPASLEN